MNVRWRMIGLAASVAASVALGQCCPGDMHGRITDTSGKPIVGAEVSIHDCTTGPDSGWKSQYLHLQSTSGADGHYVIPHTPWGPCSITIAAKGFETVVLSKQTFAIDSNRELNEQMTVQPEVLFQSGVPDSKPRWEYGALVQGGNGVTDQRNDFHFLSAGGHLGRVLTSDFGPGILKGNFEYAVEVFPYWQAFTPKFSRVNCYNAATPGATLVGTGTYCTGPYTSGGTYTGVSVTPIILRWNLTGGQKWMPWVQGAGGLVWTNHKFPGFPGAGAAVNLNNDGPYADTSVFNFTPQFGLGTHYFVKPRRSVDFSANAVHISSASLGDKNPGVNASVQFTVGYTWWK